MEYQKRNCDSGVARIDEMGMGSFLRTVNFDSSDGSLNHTKLIAPNWHLQLDSFHFKRWRRSFLIVLLMDLFIYDLFWCLYLRKSHISIFLESRCRARNPRSQSFWDLIVQRVGRRLNCWKGAYFTLGRRITLIQTCSACYTYTSVLSLIGQAPVEKFFVGWG